MRKMGWVIIAWNVLMLVWIVSTLGGAADNCADEIGRAQEACEAGTAVGAGIGLAFILFIAALGDIILGVLYLATGRGSKAPKSSAQMRECPHCKSSIRADASVCPHCQRESTPWRFWNEFWWKEENGKNYFLRGSKWIEFKHKEGAPPAS